LFGEFTNDKNPAQGDFKLKTYDVSGGVSETYTSGQAQDDTYVAGGADNNEYV